MKLFTKLTAILLFIVGGTFAQSYHTITIDGTNDFNSDENLTTSTSGYVDYFTWDANNIYFGISGSDVDTEGKVSFIYIDTDPQATPSDGSGSTSSINWSVTHTFPFTANWAFAYKVQSGDDYWNLRKYDGGWQADQSFTGSVGLGTDYLEVSIPRSDIGSPDEIYITIFMQNDDGSWTWSAAPSDAITDGNGSHTFAHYLGYTLDDGYSPNDDNAHDYLLRKNSAYLSFDGSNDYVKYNDDATLGRLDGATDYTLEAWIYPVDGTVAEYDRVFQRYYSFAIVMYDGNNDGKVEDWYFQVYDKESSSWKIYNTEGDATLTLDAWNHIAVINNSSDGTLKLYVGSNDVTTSGGYSNRAMPSSSNSDNLYIGQKGNGSDYFGGYIDEVRFKNVAEDPADLHSSKTDNEYMHDGNCAALFHFDEGTGTNTLNEASGTNAALNNGPAWETDVSELPFETGSSPVPVELTSFTANLKGNKVELNWQTATEVNNYGFEIQRSTENSGWTAIGFVEGHGSSNSPKYYSYVDNPIDKGLYSYKLKQIDLDGAFKFSDVVSVDLGSVTKFALKQNYPNPFNPTTEISFDVPKESNVRLSVYNSLGQKVADLLNEKLSAGTHRVKFDGSYLTSGIYFYKMESGGFTEIKKMILMK